MLIGATETVVTSESDSKGSRIRHVTRSMGAPDKQYYCGGLGFGLAAKICNNYLSCTIILANAEAMATGVKLGLDPRLLYKVISGSTGQNFMIDHVCPVPGVVAHAPSSNGYRLGFKSQMLSKDVGLGVEAALGVGIEPSIGKAAIAVFDKMADEGTFAVRQIVSLLEDIANLSRIETHLLCIGLLEDLTTSTMRGRATFEQELGNDTKGSIQSNLVT